MRILVVEDEAALRSYLVPLLEREGFAAEAVATGADALAAVADRRPDLVLLDVSLPDLSGLEVCRAIRRRSDYLPVLMLTGRDSPADELRGFEAQADDYITKPIVPQALLARIRAALRLAAIGGQGHLVELSGAVVDLRSRQARRDGRQLAVAAKEFELLAFLIEHPGQVFGKAQLLSQVWGPDFDGDPHTVEARISNLRIALGDSPNRPCHLHNRHGVGYYLTLDAQ